MDEQAVLEELEGGATTGATLLVSTGMEMTLNEAVAAGIAIAQPIDDSGAAAANTSRACQVRPPLEGRFGRGRQSAWIVVFRTGSVRTAGMRC